ncbi:glycosyltransferase family 92 protein [Rhizobium sp. BK376]|uniref:glycosyltransferase family 92 protein n=1 Tax=Rhizobium sp. BK376 TaxID=2512149 RepID=UPI001044D8BC|nr:glycosyltransferase family 92 protein [Rhizobium sp. BK376]TCR92219.1 glycosyl transferase family 92 [Rhizobium sp. BK376]
MRWFKTKKSAIKKLAIRPPKPEPERQGIAIAVCVKDEANYIEEWVRFHRAVGICHFIVYDNGSSDQTCALLRQALDADMLTIVPWAGQISDAGEDRLIDGQVVAFAHAILNFGGAFRRMAFVDADEFLLPMRGKTVEEALAAVGDFPNVSLPWHMFGTSGHKTKPKGPLALNYTKRASDPLSNEEHVTNFKCIVDPCEVIEVSVHQFKTREFGDLTANDAGKRFSRRARKSREFYSNRFLQLNHYYSKSEEELRAKMARGSAYAVSKQQLEEKMLTTMRHIEADVVEDRAMIEFLERNGIDLR